MLMRYHLRIRILKRLNLVLVVVLVLATAVFCHIYFSSLPFSGDTTTFFERGERISCRVLQLVCKNGQAEVVNFYGILSLIENDLVQHWATDTSSFFIGHLDRFHYIHTSFHFVFVILTYGFIGWTRGLYSPRVHRAGLSLTLLLLVIPMFGIVSHNGQIDIVSIFFALLAFFLIDNTGKILWPGTLLGVSLAYKPVLLLVPLMTAVYQSQRNNSKTYGLKLATLAYCVFVGFWSPTLFNAASRGAFAETLNALVRELIMQAEPTRDSLLYQVMSSMGLLQLGNLIVAGVLLAFSFLASKLIPNSLEFFGVGLLMTFGLTLRVHPQYAVLLCVGMLLITPKLGTLPIVVYIASWLFIQYSHPWAAAGVGWAKFLRDQTYYSTITGVTTTAGSQLVAIAVVCIYMIRRELYIPLLSLNKLTHGPTSRSLT